MGGINHQPCNKAPGKYLYFSTLMSRSMSVARSEFELANVSLEDILLSEMSRKKGETTEIEAHLKQSMQSMLEMMTAIRDLRTDMHRAGYTDLPTLRSLPLEERGKDFARSGIVDRGQWDAVASMMESQGFYSVLMEFESQAASIVETTDELLASIVNLRRPVSSGDLTYIVERNLSGNLKVPFARLYAKWIAFQGFFLASSMLSTELWYAFNNDGSVLDLGKNRANVA